MAPALALASAPYDGHALVRVQVDTPDDVLEVQGLELDIWDERPGPPALVARVRPEQWPMLDASGVDYEVVVFDLQPRIDAEALRLAERPASNEEFLADFRTLDEIDARIDAMATDHPGLVEAFDVGLSLEGRPIRGLKIASGDDKPAMLINAGQHAREWIAVMASMCAAESFVARAEEPAVASLLEQLEIIVVPVVNPDGYAYSWEVERLWRKNRRDGHGVDLNRNFSVAWGAEGSSGNPEAGNYRGEAPFSEPETVAVRDLVDANPHIVSHVDLHSFGQLVLYPWGFTDEPAPAVQTLAALATDLADALGFPHEAQHTPLQGALFYPAAGNMPDWTYGEHGVFAFTFELRPDEVEVFDTGFVLPPTEIPLVCDETIAALDLLAAWSVDRRPAMPGDDGAASTTSPGDTGEGSSSTGDIEATSARGTSDDGGETTAETTTEHDDGASTDSPADGAPQGCGCTGAVPQGRTAWVLVGLAFIRRRRKSDEARPSPATRDIA